MTDARLAERVRSALVAAHIARRDRWLGPLESQLERATVVYFAKQAVWLKDRLLRRESTLNPARLKEGAPEDIGLLLDEMFLEFSPQYSKDLTRITKVAKQGALKHATEDFGYQMGFMLDNPQAQDWLRDHCALKVKGINNVTERILRVEIQKGHRAQLSYHEIAKNIISRAEEFAAPRSGPGVRTRAELIAVNELGDAYEGSMHDAGSLLAAKGVPMLKEWSDTGDGKVCPLCLRNREAGRIPMDEAFPSGHQRALGHVGCRCTVLYEMDEAAADRIIGPREVPKPEPAPKPAKKGKKPTPAEAIRAEVAALRGKLGQDPVRKQQVEARIKEINADMDHWLPLLAGKGDAPEMQPHMKRIQALHEERKALQEEWMNFDRAPTTGDKATIMKYLDRPISERSLYSVKLSAKLGMIKEKSIDPGQAFIRRIVHGNDAEKYIDPTRPGPGGKPATYIGKLYTKVEVFWTKEHKDPAHRNNRAFADHGRIYMTQNGHSSTAATFVHEYGHVMDTQSRLRATNGTRFRDYRSGKDKLEKLKTRHPGSGYRDDEYTRPDRFKDDYCGKVYFKNGISGGPAWDDLSEITSMGLQYLFEDPVRFLWDDPEYFEFMIFQLRGVRWEAP